jgi:hypothetical protein
MRTERWDVLTFGFFSQWHCNITMGTCEVGNGLDQTGMRSRKAPKNYQTTRNSLGSYTFPSTLNGLLNVWDHTISNRAGKEPPSLLLVPVTKYLKSTL